jgi:hypothetical protein
MGTPPPPLGLEIPKDFRDVTCFTSDQKYFRLHEVGTQASGLAKLAKQVL